MATRIHIPQSLQIGEAVATALGFAISTITVLARLYTRITITRSMKIEDYLSVCSWISYAAFMSITLVIEKTGTDRDGASYQRVSYLAEIDTILYDPVIVLVKAAIIFQYKTLFVTQRRDKTSIVIQSMLWINVVAYSIFTMLVIFRCSPRAKSWNPLLPGRCLDGQELQVVIGGLNVVSDFLIFILPMPLIWALNLSTRKKIEVMGIFGVGLTACVASIIRLCYIVQMLHIQEGPVDYLLNICRIGIWSNAEIAIGIIVGCLPSLPKLLRHLRDNKTRAHSARVFQSRDLVVKQPLTIGYRIRAVFKPTDRGPNLETPRRPSCIPNSVKHQISTLKLHSTYSPNLNDDEDMFISLV